MVKLSDGERLILVMLSEMYEQLKIEGEVDPKFMLAAIHSGNTWALKWKYPGILSEGDDDNSPTVHEVVDILAMWDMIEYSYRELSPEDKKRVETEAAPFGRHVQFRGFDGNNEGEHMSVARFLIDDLDRFADFKGRDLNSHAPSLDTYRRMLAAFTPLRSSIVAGPLSATQIIQVLKEQTHPEQRK
jgi:uncharacterized protein